MTKKRVIVMRLNITDTSTPLDNQISDLCAVNYAAGYTLVSTFVHEASLVLIFQLR